MTIVIVRASFPIPSYQDSAGAEHERFALVCCDAALLVLTTSGDSMSCRKEWRLRVVRGFGMVVSGQRSEFRGALDEP